VTRFEEMLNAIGDSLSDLASSDDEEDVEDEEADQDDTELGKLSEDDEPGRVMGTISKTVQHRMEKFWQKQRMLDEFTQSGWGDAANIVIERDKKYGMAELTVQAVVNSQMDDVPAPPAPTTFADLNETHDNVSRVSHISQGTSRPGSSHIRQRSGKPQSQP